MKILGVDTASKSCSVGLLDNDALLAEITLVSGKTHSIHLMGLIENVIRLAGLTLKDLDGFAVIQGPGSFTGLRIGISTVKGLAFASGKPVVGISSLDALAMQAYAVSSLVCPILDARKGEVYSCLYRVHDGVLKKEITERVGPVETVVSVIREPCLFIGDGALAYKDQLVDHLGRSANFVPACHNAIRGSTAARLGMERLNNHEEEDVAALVPHYIRKSDAELNRTKECESHSLPRKKPTPIPGYPVESV